MLTRRSFFKLLAAIGITTTIVPSRMRDHFSSVPADEKTATNISDALKYPRVATSMPGKFPAKVSQIIHNKCVVDEKINQATVDEMVKAAMLGLTGLTDISAAWLTFVSPNEVIGLKVNPVAGKELSTSLEIVRSIISQLKAAGIPDKNIVIWDRREFEMQEVGFTAEAFPGIKITGTECKDEKGSFYDANGKLYSEARIDKDWFYKASCTDKYDAETLPYMINEGEYSYFTRIVTKDVDKIINIPILKNAGASITLCLKNLAFGSITNTGRLHKTLWHETCAEVCAFPPLRDKVVLNIVDGIKGCFNGGPGANPQFITNFNTVLAGSDAVAVDRVGYDIILKKRIAENIQKEDSAKGKKFMELAAGFGLGEANLEKIELKKEVIG